LTKSAITPFPLRMAPDLKEWLSERAGRNLRSMNNEVIAILTDYRKRELELDKAA